MASIKTWARSFARWIKSFFGGADTKPIITADDYNANAALYRIVDDGIPGCVELWKIVPRRAGGDLVLILLDIAQLKQDLGLRCSISDSRADPWQHQLSRGLAGALKAQSDVDSTHLVIALWLRDRSCVDAKGRRYRIPTAILVGVWGCELQGAMGSLNGNRIARAVVKGAAYKLFRTQNSHPLIWEQFVAQVPWLEWLDAYAKHYLGETHILQPVKRRPKIKL